jgi:hypothetical protein
MQWEYPIAQRSLLSSDISNWTDLELSGDPCGATKDSDKRWNDISKHPGLVRATEDGRFISHDESTPKFGPRQKQDTDFEVQYPGFPYLALAINVDKGKVTFRNS